MTQACHGQFWSALDPCGGCRLLPPCVRLRKWARVKISYPPCLHPCMFISCAPGLWSLLVRIMTYRRRGRRTVSHHERRHHSRCRHFIQAPTSSPLLTACVIMAAQASSQVVCLVALLVLSLGKVPKVHFDAFITRLHGAVAHLNRSKHAILLRLCRSQAAMATQVLAFNGTRIDH